MPVYSYKITTAAASEKETEIEIRGDVVTWVRIRYPPGPVGLLRVAVFYGIKQIWPDDEGTWFYGDDEAIEWDEYWELPESPCKLIIKTKNDDDTYSHTVYVIMLVKKYEHTLARQISRSLIGIVGKLFGKF